MLLGKCTKSNWPVCEVGKTYAFTCFNNKLTIYHGSDRYHSFGLHKFFLGRTSGVRFDYGLSMIFLTVSPEPEPHIEVEFEQVEDE